LNKISKSGCDTKRSVIPCYQGNDIPKMSLNELLFELSFTDMILLLLRKSDLFEKASSFCLREAMKLCHISIVVLHLLCSLFSGDGLHDDILPACDLLDKRPSCRYHPA